jgi:hypothetical protein
MSDYKPQSAEEHFALQRTTNATEVVKTVLEAQQKASEDNRSANERFYNSLALFSSGTVALSVTYLGYLKNLPRPAVVQHSHWLMACWICLLVCIICSLFWVLIYSNYTYYFHEWQTANAQKEKFEADAKEYPTLVRNSISVKTRAPISAEEVNDFISIRMKAAEILDKKQQFAKGREKFYTRCWRLLGWAAQVCFISGFALLIAFAVENT